MSITTPYQAGTGRRAIAPQLQMLLPPALIVLCALAMLIHGPIAQLSHYHDFADQRRLLGLANAADVLSNLGFILAGCYGLARGGPVNAGYRLFYLALLLTALGSSFYHLAPDNARLVFDRLPIALACAGLLAGVWADTAGARTWLTPALALCAIASVLWWRHTDLHGAGDLRPYLLLQLLPLLLIPVLHHLYGAPRRQRLLFGVAIGLYLLAKACELGDHRIYAMLGTLSGHTLKHLLSALGAACVVLAAPKKSGGPAKERR